MVSSYSVENVIPFESDHNGALDIELLIGNPENGHAGILAGETQAQYRQQRL
jgi:hypothetical protein